MSPLPDGFPLSPHKPLTLDLLCVACSLSGIPWQGPPLGSTLPLSVLSAAAIHMVEGEDRSKLMGDVALDAVNALL